VLLALGSRAGAESQPCAQVQSELRTLDAALELYHANHGAYPPAARWFDALKEDRLIRAELNGRDRWDHAYQFIPSADQRSFDLRSVGPDGVHDTADDQRKADGWRWSQCKSSRGGC
jgi:hypothetical protein